LNLVNLMNLMTANLNFKKILLIEDQAIVRDTIKHILGSLGARHIVEAESGMNGMAAMSDDKFDIVLCDYNLGAGRNGQQVLEEAKHLKLLPLNAIFIMVTGEQHLNMILSALDNKLDDYLIKPFTPQQLSSRLERCIVRKKYLASDDGEIDCGNLIRPYKIARSCLSRTIKKCACNC